jgi:lysophospholipase L1-like esterase
MRPSLQTVHQAARRAVGQHGFRPNQIPQIAAGEYWLPGVGVSGAATISWAGRNGTNTMTAAAAQTPDAVTGPGGNAAWQFSQANSDIFTVATPAGPLVTTDGVYVACWFRFDSLDVTNRVVIEQHGSAGARKWQLRKTASVNVLRVEWSDDGTNLLASDVSLTEAEGVGTVTQLDKYLFCEIAIDPAGGSLPAKTRMWLNMREVTWENQSGAGGAALFNGGVFRLGNNNFENQDFNGQIGPVYVGTKVGGVLLPSDHQRMRLMRYFAPKQQRLQVVVDGNSLTAGQGASVAGVTSYPGVLRASLAAQGIPTRDVHDRGLGGASTQDMIDGFATRVEPFFDAFFSRNALVFFEVRNSTVDGQTAAQILAQYQEYAELGRAAGFWVVACTAPPTDGDAVGQGVAGAANTLIRANWESFADAFIDLELVPEFTPAGNIANPTYYSDGVHLTDAGYALIAARVETAVLAGAGL